jgi:FixJ family two-component response regulator
MSKEVVHTPNQQTNVYVVDDDPSVRAALEDLLETVPLKVRSFASVHEFLASKRPDAPACLVLDVRATAVRLRRLPIDTAMLAARTN